MRNVIITTSITQKVAINDIVTFNLSATYIIINSASKCDRNQFSGGAWTPFFLLFIFIFRMIKLRLHRWTPMLLINCHRKVKQKIVCGSDGYGYCQIYICALALALALALRYIYDRFRIAIAVAMDGHQGLSLRFFMIDVTDKPSE